MKLQSYEEDTIVKGDAQVDQVVLGGRRVGSGLEGFLAGIGSAVGLYLLITIFNSLQPMVSVTYSGAARMSLAAFVILSIVFWAVFREEEKKKAEQSDPANNEKEKQE